MNVPSSLLSRSSRSDNRQPEAPRRSCWSPELDRRSDLMLSLIITGGCHRHLVRLLRQIGSDVMGRISDARLAWLAIQSISAASGRISARLWGCLSACSATGANVGNDGLNGLAARLVANVLRPKQSVGSCYGRPGRIFRPACGSSVPVLLCLRHGSRHGEDEDCY